MVEWANRLNDRQPDDEVIYELYDYRVDPGETNNWVDERPIAFENLKSMLVDTYEPPVKVPAKIDGSSMKPSVGQQPPKI